MITLIYAMNGHILAGALVYIKKEVLLSVFVVKKQRRGKSSSDAHVKQEDLYYYFRPSPDKIMACHSGPDVGDDALQMPL